MTRLDDYRSALLAAFSSVSAAELAEIVDTGGPDFVSFIIDHGLGPLWHERTGWVEKNGVRTYEPLRDEMLLSSLADLCLRTITTPVLRALPLGFGLPTLLGPSS